MLFLFWKECKKMFKTNFATFTLMYYILMYNYYSKIVIRQYIYMETPLHTRNIYMFLSGTIR